MFVVIEDQTHKNRLGGDIADIPLNGVHGPFEREEEAEGYGNFLDCAFHIRHVTPEVE